MYLVAAVSATAHSEVALIYVALAAAGRSKLCIVAVRRVTR